MAKINAIMDIGKRAMMNSQTGIQTVSHNIANKSTEGYSRQRVEMKANEPIGLGKTRVGMGARPGDVTRTTNEFLEKQIANEQTKLGFSKGEADYMMRVEQIFNEQINKGLNQFMGDFFNSFREFANQPESTSNRALVKETAEHVGKDFTRVNKQLKDIQSEMDFQLQVEVESINRIAAEIADINKNIQTVEMSGGHSNDERDRRDLLLKELGEKINIRVGEGKDGRITVTAGDTALIVSGFESGRLEAVPTAAKDRKREGNFDIMFTSNKYDQPVAITRQIREGTLGGVINVRDNVVNNLREKLDQLAHHFSKSVNEVHRMGFNLYNEQGLDFFEPIGQVEGASEAIRVNSEIMDDPAKIAGAASAKSPGDSRVALVIANLQFAPSMGNNMSTMADFYNGIVGELAVSTKKTNSAFEHQAAVLDQLKNIRESISGVSLDEEAVKMIEYQRAFEASAKVIKTADEMFQTILNLKS